MTATGYTVRIRGAASLIARDYMCPEHGPFDALAARDSEDEQPCPCGMPSPRIDSAPAVHTQFVVSGSQGKSDAKPHHMSMDTRPLAEGMPLGEWKAQRKQLWEQERKRKVMEATK